MGALSEGDLKARSVGNTSVLRETALIEAFNLKSVPWKEDGIGLEEVYFQRSLHKKRRVAWALFSLLLNFSGEVICCGVVVKFSVWWLGQEKFGQ